MIDHIDQYLSTEHFQQDWKSTIFTWHLFFSLSKLIWCHIVLSSQSQNEMKQNISCTWFEGSMPCHKSIRRAWQLSYRLDHLGSLGTWQTSPLMSVTITPFCWPTAFKTASYYELLEPINSGRNNTIITTMHQPTHRDNCFFSPGEVVTVCILSLFFLGHGNLRWLNLNQFWREWQYVCSTIMSCWYDPSNTLQ